jgi:arylsulfatase A-like enzyme
MRYFKQKGPFNFFNKLERGMRKILCGFICGLAWASVSAGLPNIILINIDDMGYADVTPFGNTELRTPHIQKLADGGRKFTDFYAAPTCTMSRARLMTGCYNPRVSMNSVLFPGDGKGLHPDEVTIAEVLKQRGYATACVGKWHLGDVPDMLPTAQGFDSFFGLPYSNDMHAKRRAKGKLCPPLPVIRGTEVIETEPDQAYLTKRYTEETIKIINEKKDEPFFIYLAHTMVHLPLAASPDFKGKSKGGLIGDTIEEIDWSVGQVLQTLEELGLADNTLVIFTSDNGPAKREAPPFRGNKQTNWEGGVRVPTIMRWPGRIPAGTTCDRIAGMIDILPTFAAMAEVKLDPKRIIDGKNMLPLMTEVHPKPVHHTELYYRGGQNKPDGIRMDDWKLLVQYPERIKKAPKNGPWLFNLKDDAAESSNVAQQHPEIVERLTKELKKREAEINNNTRPAGRVKK